MPELSTIPITSLDDPRVAAYANIKDRQLRFPGGVAHDSRGEFADGSFIAEGELVVKLLVASRFRTRSVLLTPTRVATMRAELERLPAGTPIYVADASVMDAIVGFNIHRGVLACGERGAPMSLEALLAAAPRGLVILEGLTNHDNVGAMFRNVAALASGFGVLLSPTCCDPLYRKAIRVSMGHALRIPFAFADEWPAAIVSVAGRGYEVLALTPDARAENLKAIASPQKPAILLGSEGPGLTSEAMSAATRRVRIPMAGDTDSLNVAVAGAIAMFVLGNEGGS